MPARSSTPTSHVDLFEHGFRQFVRDMVDGLRADLRTIVNIRTMRYALVGVGALLFAVTALGRLAAAVLRWK